MAPNHNDISNNKGDFQMTEEEYKIVTAMSVWGGGFVKGLANLMKLADHNNFKRLKNAFPEYWEQYSKMADKL